MMCTRTRLLNCNSKNSISYCLLSNNEGQNEKTWLNDMRFVSFKRSITSDKALSCYHLADEVHVAEQVESSTMLIIKNIVKIIHESIMNTKILLWLWNPWWISHSVNYLTGKISDTHIVTFFQEELLCLELSLYFLSYSTEKQYFSCYKIWTICLKATRIFV